MKFFSPLFLFFSCFFFSACSSSTYLMTGAPRNPTPLYSLATVSFVSAAEVPVAPGNGKYLGTIETTGSTACSADAVTRFLTRKARSLGANLVYVKKSEESTTVTYVGYTTMSQKCTVVIADFFYANTGAQTKIEQAVDKDNTANAPGNKENMDNSPGFAMRIVAYIVGFAVGFTLVILLLD